MNSSPFVKSLLAPLRRGTLLTLMAILVAGAARADSVLVISEFQAYASEGLEDGDGVPRDWIEIHNQGFADVDLSGLWLTDDPDHLEAWPLPSRILPAGGYLVILASGEDRVDGDELHASFELDADGEYLALLGPGGEVLHAYLPGFPPQRRGYTGGLAAEPVSLISRGSRFEMILPADGELGDSWRHPEFAPGSGWGTVNLPMGYDRSGQVGLPEEVVAYWPLDGDVLDHARENHGQFRGGQALHVEGFDGTPGGALEFDGIDDLVEVEQSSGLPIHRQEAFTISMWVRGGPQVDRRVFSEGSSSNNTPVFNIGTRSSGGSEVDLFVRAPDGSRPLSHRLSQARPFDGTWHHLAWVDEDGQARLYVDGELDGQDFNYSRVNMSLDRTSLGAILRATDSFHFRGALDEVSLWERALDAEEVALLAGGATPGELGGGLPPDVTVVEDEFLGVHPTAYLRRVFEVVEPGALDRLGLELGYDAGVVVALNGIEIFRDHAPDPVTWRSQATAEQPAGIVTRRLDLALSPGDLRAGANVLAIQVLNSSRDDLDLFLSATLEGRPPLEAAARFFSEASPGAANRGVVEGFVDEPRFSHRRGIHEAPIELELETNTPEATIFITRDGRIPDPDRDEPVTGPLELDSTVVIRARAFREGWIPSETVTRTFVFLDSIPDQAPPPDAPSSWDGAPASYVLDPDVVNDPRYSDRLEEAFTSLPLVSLALEPGELFGPAGLYQNPGGRGRAWEKPVSVEWISGEAPGRFQVDAGLRVHGNTSRNVSNNPKLGLRLLFRGSYGPSRLEEPLFGTEGVTRFDTLVLRSNNRDSWIDPDTSRRRSAQFVYDEFLRTLQGELGQVHSRGRFVHLFLNGLYWGIYQVVERPDEDFAADHHGGQGDDYDVIKNHEEVQAGTRATYDELITRTSRDLRLLQNYQDIEEILDVDNFIDYLLANFYAPALDWPGNYYLSRSRLPGGQFRFYCWDSDLAFDEGFSVNRTLPHRRDADSPTKFFHALRVSPEFRLAFADRVERAFSDGGPLSSAGAPAIWRRLSETLAPALVAEAARWGTHRERNPGMTPDERWAPLNLRIEEVELPARSSLVLEQLQAGGLVSQVEPPEIVAPSVRFRESLTVRITSLEGETFYSIEGDPRLPGGDLAPHAVLVPGGQVDLEFQDTTTLHVRSRLEALWSAGLERTFHRDAGLRITEIHYHPRGGGPHDEDAMEFIELANTGSEEIELDGYSLGGGIEFDFTGGAIAVLGPGESVLVVENEEAFTWRYGRADLPVAGSYSGRLANDGERLVLRAPDGLIVHDFEYRDDWWPASDGEGASLEIVDLELPPESWGEATSWVTSDALHGTPGEVAGFTEGGFQVPGDANQDSRLEIGDAITLLVWLFRGQDGELPCAGLTVNEGGNRGLLDLDGNGGVDLGDAVQVLSYLFRDGTGPAQGLHCRRLLDCPDACAR